MPKTKQLFFAALVSGWVFGFAACTMQNEGVSYEDRTLDELSQREWPVATTQEESRIDNRPIARGGELDTPSELYPGEPVEYYENEFRRMGFNIMDVDYEADRVLYDLRNNDIMYQVALLIPDDKTRVQRLEWKQYRRIDVQPNLQDETTKNIRQQVTRLQPGQAPVDYLDELDQIGTVLDYERKPEQALVLLETGTREYTVALKVDPQTNRVTTISMDRYAWQTIQ